MLSIPHSKFNLFMDKIQAGYRSSVQYHNDIHGTDILQFGFYLLKNTYLIDIAMLSELDVFSFLFACVCNDYGHDGLNNSYHMNKVTERAIRFNDFAV